MPTKIKEKEVADLKEMLSKASSIIIADHTGINVNELTGLRRDLKNAKAEFKVAKNTLLRIASKELGLEDAIEHFVGPTSMILGYDDPSVPAKIIHSFRKKTNRPHVRAYLLDKQQQSLEFFTKIAQLSSKEEVLAELIGSIEGPLVMLVMTFEGVIRNFIGLLDSLGEKRK